MSLETIRLSQREKDQLIAVKRNLDIDNWNILCRWALCLSLAEPSPPPEVTPGKMSNVEMSWRTFAGDYSDTMFGLIQTRQYIDKGDIENLLKRHLFRGINYLAAKKELQIRDLISDVL